MTDCTRHSIVPTLIYAVCTVGFALFLAPVFTGIINLGNTVGMSFFTLLALITLFRSRLAALAQNGLIRFCFITVTVIAALLIILAAVESVFMIAAACKKPQGDCTLVILGCRVKEGNPSLMLSKRINAAYDYMSENPGAMCILSGGQGKDEIISEAQCMYNILTAKGISPDRLFMEDKSTSTYENIHNSADIIKKNGLPETVAIVTSEFHQYRAQLIAKKQGIDAYAISSHTMIFLLPTYWVRDCFGVAYEIAF